MRNLRSRQVVLTALGCVLAALLAMPALVATAGAGPPGSEEYDLELPSDPNQAEDTDDAKASGADPAAEPAVEPAPEPAPVGEPTPTAGAPAGGNGSDSGDADGEGSRSDEGSGQTPVFEPRLASGGTPGNPAADHDFPILPVALAAAAVLAVPFGIWLMRRSRA